MKRIPRYRFRLNPERAEGKELQMSKEEIRIRLKHALKHVELTPDHPLEARVAKQEIDYILYELDKELDKT